MAGRNAEVDDAAVGGAPVELHEFLLCSGKAHLQPFHLAEPPLALGLGNAGEEVVSDLDEPRGF
ncbi:hypothetical protein [Streptomyces sp. NBC_01669]|uniref:hypothetical protein n=1 Tax=Streptomyces sp. NBC_01669 TaxID=2975909 RepID=UPI002258010D|nr:hypothetical protein [Streptomyces sp. NBC_01669]MCX4531082.1 hypothetical protein [Streptomyces sp. NBC_01669]